LSNLDSAHAGLASAPATRELESAHHFIHPTLSQLHCCILLILLRFRVLSASLKGVNIWGLISCASWSTLRIAHSCSLRLHIPTPPIPPPQRYKHSGAPLTQTLSSGGLKSGPSQNRMPRRKAPIIQFTCLDTLFRFSASPASVTRPLPARPTYTTWILPSSPIYPTWTAVAASPTRRPFSINPPTQTKTATALLLSLCASSSLRVPTRRKDSRYFDIRLLLRPLQASCRSHCLPAHPVQLPL
jgi:hypothetical protein